MAQIPPQPRSRDDFRVAIFCALPVEAGMVQRVFDNEWNGAWLRKKRGDNNTYTTGSIGEHNVVLVHMPGMGTTAATTALAGLRTSFPGVEIAFAVGICGASPVDPRTQEEICLTDCIVSTALVQYDFGRQYPGQFVRKADLEDTLGRAGPTIRALLAKLQSPENRRPLKRKLAQHLHSLQQRGSTVPYPGLQMDRLYDVAYLHSHHDTNQLCDKCINEMGVCAQSCDELGCDERQSSPRERLAEYPDLADKCLPRLHFGRYGSANTVVKSGMDRDRLARENQLLAFEMEAAGLWEYIPTLVVKSACDYADSHKSKQWQACAAATAAAGLKAILEYYEPSDRPLAQNKYDVPFSLEGVPVPKKFIDRPAEMYKVEQALLPTSASNIRNSRRKAFVLRGLGGIGKTQLAVGFIRLHHAEFSAVFWLDGSSEDSLKQSIVQQRSRITHEWTSEDSIDDIVAELIEWLKQPDNSEWLMVIDNIDREHSVEDPLSYDVKKYIPSADHGSILITTRLAQLEQLGESQELKKVTNETAAEILNIWYGLSSDQANVKALLERLDGLPLAIAQAGSYLHKTGISIDTYLRLYDEQSATIAEALDKSDTLLDDYPNRSVWTTWNISFDAIHKKNEHVANLLIFWSCIDRNDLWYGLFKRALRTDSITEALSRKLGDIASEELSFIKAMEMLRGYSLIEGTNPVSVEGYMMHTVVHRWVHFFHGQEFMLHFRILALFVVAFATPSWDEHDAMQLLQRLLPHANMCSTMMFDTSLIDSREDNPDDSQIDHAMRVELLDAMHKLAHLYHDLGKFAEAERMFVQVLAGKEVALGLNHESTLNSVNRLASLYRRLGRLSDAEDMGKRALAAREQILGHKHRVTLYSCNVLGLIYIDQGRLDEAEKMFVRMMEAREEVWVANDPHRATAMSNLGHVYGVNGKLDEAEKLYLRAIEIQNKSLGPKHKDTLLALGNLASVYRRQKKLVQAEQVYLQVLHSYEEILDPQLLKTFLPVAGALSGLGDIYFESRPEESRAMYERALAIRSTARGDSYKKCVSLKKRLRKLENRRNQSQTTFNDAESSQTTLQESQYSKEDSLKDNSTGFKASLRKMGIRIGGKK